MSRFGNPPEWMPPSGMEAWQLLEEELPDTAKVDRLAMILMCSAYATAEDAMRELAQQGALVPGRKDARVKNPAAQIAREAAASFRQWVSEFGLSPAARKKLGIESKPKESQHDDLID